MSQQNFSNTRSNYILWEWLTKDGKRFQKPTEFPLTNFCLKTDKSSHRMDFRMDSENSEPLKTEDLWIGKISPHPVLEVEKQKNRNDINRKIQFILLTFSSTRAYLALLHTKNTKVIRTHMCSWKLCTSACKQVIALQRHIHTKRFAQKFYYITFLFLSHNARGWMRVRRKLRQTNTYIQTQLFIIQTSHCVI